MAMSGRVPPVRPENDEGHVMSDQERRDPERRDPVRGAQVRCGSLHGSEPDRHEQIYRPLEVESHTRNRALRRECNSRIGNKTLRGVSSLQSWEDVDPAGDPEYQGAEQEVDRENVHGNVAAFLW